MRRIEEESTLEKLRSQMVSTHREKEREKERERKRRDVITASMLLQPSKERRQRVDESICRRNKSLRKKSRQKKV